MCLSGYGEVQTMDAEQKTDAFQQGGNFVLACWAW